MRTRKPMVLSSSKLRSRFTNGAGILADIDGRSGQARRFRDLCALFVADLGGGVGLSEGQTCIVRRAACLAVELERMESKFAINEGATAPQLETYQRASNSLRRLLESLGIHRGRIARNITPPSLTDYIEGKANRVGRVRRLDDDDGLEAAE